MHYTGMNSDEQANHANCAARVRAIQAFHMSPAAGGSEGPWADIAYNWLVCKHGYVFTGRGWLTRSAAQGTNEGNAYYHAVCFLGDDTAGRDDVTRRGRIALAQIVGQLILRAPYASAIHPHSHFHPTACPGEDLRLAIFRLRLAFEGRS